jgi:hypothetical protein
VAKLLAPDGAASDFFGTSVSISGDFALVGALQDDDKGLDSGSAYMFQRNGSDWTFLSKLNASDGMSNDLFGGAAAIDGFSAVMGATGVGGNGSAYVFAAVPEPSSFCLMAVAIGFGSAAWFYRRCRQRSGGIVMTR